MDVELRPVLEVSPATSRSPASVARASYSTRRRGGRTATGARLGYDPERLADVNRRAVAPAAQLRDESQLGEPVVINGVIGPRGDGYVPGERMSARDAEEYHAEQIGTFAETVAAVCALW